MDNALGDEAQCLAQAALADHPIASLRDLQVAKNKDRLLISGRVQSFYHKQMAQEVVRAVTTNWRVVNDVAVDDSEFL